VAPAVFKTDVAEDLGQAGSIPVRLRYRADHRTRIRPLPAVTDPTTAAGTP
jgi:hypothetical protein